MLSLVVLTLLAATGFVAAQPSDSPRASQDGPPTPIRWAASDVTQSVKPGQTVVVQIAAQIDEGWHLYALDPIEGGPIPTKLSAGPNPPFTLADKDIQRADPKRSHDPNFGIETAYYEDSASFGLPIVVAANAAAGEKDVEITARFQACNEQICLRPQTATMRVKIRLQK